VFGGIEERTEGMSNFCKPDWANAALLTIDVQQDFALPGAPAEIPSTAEAVPGMRPLVWAFRQANRPVVHVVRLYRPDGSNVDLCRRYDAERGKCVVLSGTGGVNLVSVDELSQKLTAEVSNA
jgi:nicotinamidase-related amidase